MLTEEKAREQLEGIQQSIKDLEGLKRNALERKEGLYTEIQKTVKNLELDLTFAIIDL